MTGTNHDIATRPAEAQSPQALAFPVVGLGASAGGLAALRRFFEHVPPRSGMAFVVVLHLSPRHKSTADQFLSKATSLPVRQVTHRTRIEPGHVYVIPPMHRLVTADGHLCLIPMSRAPGRHTAIDDFLRSLAQAQKDRAFAVILSGTGADGSVGIGAVKEEGGIILAQTPEDAEYGTMPRNAIATGLVDFVLTAHEIPAQIERLWANARSIRFPGAVDAGETIGEENEAALRVILGLLRARTGHDFAQYKRATVLRRIERRLQVRELADLRSYATYLRDHAAETRLLLADLLIGVTHFFRDREAFAALDGVVLADILGGRTSDDTVRVWVAGCATGEEAYSIAMLLAARAEEMLDAPQIQIFATDVDEDAIATARAGRYPQPIAADVPPALLRRFFAKDKDGSYHVHRSIRGFVTFAVHNVLKDPPFAHVDLVSCRNLLIYLTRDAQRRTLDIVHFALAPNGFLLLGSSESIDEDHAGFAATDKANRIFRRLPGQRGGLLAATPQEMAVQTLPPREHQIVRTPTARELHLAMLEAYAPPSIVVDERGDIVHLSENAHRFLQFGAGEPSLNLMKVVQPGMRAQIRAVLYDAMQTLTPTVAPEVRFVRHGRAPALDVRIHPMADEAKRRRYALVIFEEHKAPQASEGSAADAPAALVAAQLTATRQHLQALVEQYQTRNEELVAANEKLSAINEELRSASEELETSREEQQSVNEELASVNQELRTSIEEATSINNDLQNLIAATGIAVLFVDTALCLRRFTPAAASIFNVIASDVGRPLTDFTHALDYPSLGDDVQGVLDTLRAHETIVHSRGAASYAARILPYRTMEGHIRGAVLTLADVTARMRLQERQQQITEAEHEVQRQSDEQSRLKEAFLATMSHEMRNPLNAILLQTELLLGPSGMTTGDRAVRQAIVSIRQLAATQARMVDDLLDVSRQRTGKLELQRQLVPLPFIIGDAVGALAPEAVQKKISVVTELSEHPVIVAADPLRVKQIAWNIVSNAIKFTPPGGRVTVRVSTDGSDARVDVIDTGEGIEPEMLPYVFDLFRQGDSSVRRRHGGLGIGLALAKQLVEMQDGRIEARSEGKDRGAHFTVWLPLHRGQAADAVRAGDGMPAARGPDRAALSNLEVLIVDDTADTAAMMRELLSRYGARAQSFESAGEALTAARAQRFDAILSDLAMPGTDGMAFMAALRETDNAATPVIFTSGYSRPDDIARARAAGAADYLVKPVRGDLLIGAIRRAIDSAARNND